MKLQGGRGDSRILVDLGGRRLGRLGTPIRHLGRSAIDRDGMVRAVGGLRAVSFYYVFKIDSFFGNHMRYWYNTIFLFSPRRRENRDIR